MNMYSYIATSNPYQAKAILHKHGYKTTNVKNFDDLGICLKKLVAQEGESALYDILSCHPDKDIIIEKHQLDNPPKNNMDWIHQSDMNYANFIGKEKLTQGQKETSIFILAAALLLAAAIIVKK